jgi:hypothetical protein
MKDHRPHWAQIRETIEQAGGAWPPPGTREVERAVARRPPTKDYEQLVRMGVELRKLKAAIMDGNSTQRAALRERYFELEQRYNAFYND